MAIFSRKPSNGDTDMAKENNTPQQSRDNVISIIGPGMRVVGDCETDGTLRVEGTIEGTVRAGKAVVIGKDGVVVGDVVTQDAIIGGRVTGAVVAESRLELQATCVIEGEIRARRIKLDEGGRINGTVQTGEIRPVSDGVHQPAALPAGAG
jgi:cytoskeletal protein CcmA (bactofilin family)